MIATGPRILLFLLGLSVLVIIINFVRKRQLQERYALLWLLAGLALTAAPLLINQLDQVAFALGFQYPPALLLVLAVVGLLLIIFQLSLNLSRNADHLKVLTQELGLLRQEMEAMRRNANAAQGAASPQALDAGHGDSLNNATPAAPEPGRAGESVVEDTEL